MSRVKHLWNVNVAEIKISAWELNWIIYLWLLVNSLRTNHSKDLSPAPSLFWNWKVGAYNNSQNWSLICWKKTREFNNKCTDWKPCIKWNGVPDTTYTLLIWACLKTSKGAKLGLAGFNVTTQVRARIERSCSYSRWRSFACALFQGVGRFPIRGFEV